MTTKMRIASAIAAVSLTLVGCAENPADKVPSAQVQTPSAAATSEPSGTPSPGATEAAPMEGTVYAFAEGSEVGFVGSKVTGSHAGGFKKVTGMVTVPEGDLSKAAVELTVDMKSIYSDDEDLTGHLKNEDFFASVL